MKVRDVIKWLEREGWRIDRVKAVDSTVMRKELRKRWVGSKKGRVRQGRQKSRSLDSDAQMWCVLARD